MIRALGTGSRTGATNLSLGLQRRVKEPMPKSLFSTGWRFYPVPSHAIFHAKYVHVRWPGFQHAIFCLAYILTYTTLVMGREIFSIRRDPWRIGIG